MKKAILTVMTIAIVLMSVLGTPRTVVAATLTIAPTVSPGIFYKGITVGLNTYPGATIIYTRNGTTPSGYIDIWGTLRISNGIKYTGALYLSSTTTVKAISVMRYNTSSGVYSYTYQISSPTTLGNAVFSKFSSFSSNFGSYASTAAVKINTSTGIITGYMNKWNGTAINCTWYTATKLKYNNGRIMLFSSSGLNGNQWYTKAVPTSNQVKYSGIYGLESVVAANINRPVYNVVVSFSSGSVYGHVMLIDAIINGVVYYSDNFHAQTMRTKLSLAEFRNYYSSMGYTIIGVVHVK